jgi:hypothetical protein
LASQDVAAYDPIFWFFHANWDRLWWKWQQDTNATTLATFMSTLQGSSTWLKTPFNVLPPFSETADETIDLIGQFDVNYQHPQTAAPVAKLPLAAGSFSARGAISLADATMASVRVKGISRLDIPGSFTVHLMNDGETIARSGFFQPRSPLTCESCKKKGITDFDFHVPVSAIREGKLSVAIELAREDRVGKWFPIANAGDPTINVRLLLQND